MKERLPRVIAMLSVYSKVKGVTEKKINETKLSLLFVNFFALNINHF